MSETRPTLAPADDARAQLYALGWWLQSRAWDRECDVLATVRLALERLTDARQAAERSRELEETTWQVT